MSVRPTYRRRSNGQETERRGRRGPSTLHQAVVEIALVSGDCGPIVAGPPRPR